MSLITRPGPKATNFRRLTVFPLFGGVHKGVAPNDTTDSTFETIRQGGNYTGPGFGNTASASGSVQTQSVSLLGVVYVPVTNSTPAIGAGAVGFVDFDGGTVAQFPLHLGDMVLVGKTANWAPFVNNSSETLVYADALDNSGLICLGVRVIGNNTNQACRVQAVVMNPTAGPINVPVWLPNLYVVRIS